MKKAQVSMFIIIGAILLIGGILFFSLDSSSLEFFEDDKSSSKISTFVSSCLAQTTKEAQRKIAQAGGHYYHTPSLIVNYDAPKEVFKSAKGFKDLGGVKFLYWYYYDESSKRFTTQIPEYDTSSKYSLRNQIKQYLLEHTEKDCIKNFNVFNDQFEISYDPSQFEFEVQFRGDEIISSLTVDIQIKEFATESFESLHFFKSEQYNALRVPYFLARDIVAAELNTSFLEVREVQLISAYQSSSRRDLLPPFYDFKTEYDFRPWNLKETKEVFAQVMNTHLSQITFLSTHADSKSKSSYPQTEFVKGAESIYKANYLEETTQTKNIKNINFKEFKEYSVQPKYELFYPLSLTISPSSGNVLLFPEPKALLTTLVPLFTTSYSASYEAVIPIVFDISAKDPTNQLDFQFALETNIKYNKPLSERNEQLEQFEGLSTQSDSSLICNPNQFISGNYTLDIVDSINFGLRTSLASSPKGVEEAFISFSCRGLSTCYLGETKVNVTSKSSTLNVKLPTHCFPGTLTISKPEHKSIVIENLDPKLGTSVSLGTFELDSTKTLDLDLRLCSLGQICESGRVLSDDESGFVIFEHKTNPELTRVVEITAQNQYELKIPLTTGSYLISAFVINNKEQVIPDKEICYKKGLFKKKECQTIPGFTLQSWVVGQYKVEDFKVTAENLIPHSKVLINVLESKVPTNFDELEKSSHSLSEVQAKSYDPIFKKR